MEPIDVGIAAAETAAADSNPFLEATTQFIFGNEDNPAATATMQASSTADATATDKSPGATTNTALPGVGTLGLSNPNGTITLSTTTLLLIAAGLLAILLFFHKP